MKRNNPFGSRLATVLLTIFKIVPFAVILICCILYARSGGEIKVEQILAYTPDNALLAALALIGLYAVKSLSVVFPLLVLYISAGVLFSAPIAILVNTAGLLVCLSVPYWIGRFSGKELVEKLTARPRNREKEPFCGREAAEAAADWLEGLGYLDDGQYARTVAEHCAAKGYGPGRIREELYRRGVPRDCWDGALEGLSGPEEAIDAFLQKKLRGAELSDPKVRRRAADALARRGYRWEDISAGLRRYGAEPEEW